MRLLLDTHVFLAWIAGGQGLSRRARRNIAAPKPERFVSMASCWEIAIKVSLGKLRVPLPLDRFLAEQLALNAFQPLAIGLSHIATVVRLPFHHRDPFDRLLAAQALEEELSIVSADRIFAKYGVQRVW